ncbi:MAG: secretin and TonB N-terminal domain-containing protein, partial [Candidatus Binatia bacterium]
MKRDNALDAGWVFLVVGLIAAGLLTQMGCAPVKAPPRAVLTPPKAAPARAEKRREKSLPGLIVTEVEGKREPQRLYSFSLRDADIREVLMAISKQTSFNVVVDPDVQGSVTVDLKNVALSEALDTLTDLLNLSYKVKRNLIRVSIPKPETRIFSLQYVDLIRTGTSSTSAQIGAGGTVVAGGATGSSTVSTTTSTDLWTNIETGLGELISPEGQVVVDKQSGNILVTDLPKVLDRVANFLEAIEGSVQRQVLIEARIVEVILTGDYRFGIDWGAIAKAGALRGASIASADRILGQKLAPDLSGFQIGVSSTDFATLLSVLDKQGEVNVLSSPRLATLNNQTAVIRSATDEVFFETRIEETVLAGGGIRETRTSTARTVTIGVVLSITPQIGSDGSVTLHVRPTVTEKTGEARSPEGDTFPILDVREADMVVRARDGQVVVIGGLMQERKSDDES